MPEEEAAAQIISGSGAGEERLQLSNNDRNGGMEEEKEEAPVAQPTTLQPYIPEQPSDFLAQSSEAAIVEDIKVHSPPTNQSVPPLEPRKELLY